VKIMQFLEIFQICVFFLVCGPQNSIFWHSKTGSRLKKQKTLPQKVLFDVNLAIFEVQHRIFKKRLCEIDAKISSCSEKYQMSASRDAVFFNDTNGTDFAAELASWKEKRQVVFEEISKCENILQNGGKLLNLHKDLEKKSL
jgi:hypothetical protein